MQSPKKMWFKLPPQIRKPITLTVGLCFVLAAGLTGWLPGPGGIPLFLIGVTILATEFKWAERVRDTILSWVAVIGHWLRRHPSLGAALIATAIFFGMTSLYLFLTA